MWTLLNIVDPKEHRGFWPFVKRFFNVEEDFFGWKVKELVDSDGFNQHISQYAIRRMKNVLGDQLPEKTIQRLEVPLDPASTKTYNDMASDFYVDIAGDTVKAVNVVSCLTILRQMAVSSSLLDKSKHVLTDCAKMDAVIDIVEDYTGERQFVVFSNYRAVVERGSKTLQLRGMKSEFFHGETSAQDRTDIIKRFQDKEIEVLWCTIGAGGIGTTLTAADTCIFMDKHWVPEINRQAQDRLHRIGQRNNVLVVELFSPNTVDQYVEDILAGKQLTIDEALRDDVQSLAHLFGRE
jgi:SNF2 family DNA or RNA helicase